MLKKNEYVKIANDKNKNIILCILRKMGIYKISEKASKIALSDSLDDISYKILLSLIEKADNKKLMPHYKEKGKSFIRPLYLLLNSEISLYARLKNIKIGKSKEKKIKIEPSIKDFVDNLEKKHLEVKYAVVNSFLNAIN